MRFRVPYRVCQKRARSKARITEMLNGRPVGKDRAVEFTAPSFAAAQELLRKLILPDDPRPVAGRTLVRDFIVWDLGADGDRHRQ